MHKNFLYIYESFKIIKLILINIDINTHPVSVDTYKFSAVKENNSPDNKYLILTFIIQAEDKTRYLNNGKNFFHLN